MKSSIIAWIATYGAFKTAQILSKAKKISPKNADKLVRSIAVKHADDIKKVKNKQKTNYNRDAGAKDIGKAKPKADLSKPLPKVTEKGGNISIGNTPKIIKDTLAKNKAYVKKNPGTTKITQKTPPYSALHVPKKVKKKGLLNYDAD